jgi:pimeloyl-ACP methyl ester carboxylesterase
MSDFLSYDVIGDGPGLVMIHGTSSSGFANWEPVATALAADHTVVLPDLPGSGQSPLPWAPLELDTIADQIAFAAKEAGLEWFAVAGVSLGAAVAIRLATRHSSRVTALAAVAGYAWPRPSLRLALELWAAMYARQDPDTGKMLTMMSASDEQLTRLSGEGLQGLVRSATAHSAAGTAAQIDLARRVDVRADLAEIAVPALVVSPRGDRFISPAHSRELAAGIRGARLAEVDGGHAAVYETAGQVTRVLWEFLAACG